MAQQRGHYVGIDLFKLLAAAAVVYLHSVGQTDLAVTSDFTRFAVPFFAASAVFLAFRSTVNRPKPTAQYLRSRISRIYVPFLVWTTIYLLVRLLWSLGRDTRQPDVGIVLLWRGSTHHLWFLPFVLVTTILTFAVARAARSSRAFSIAAGIMLAAGVTTYLLMPIILIYADYTVSLAVSNTPVVMWTLGLMCLLQSEALTRGPVQMVRWLAPPAFLLSLFFLMIWGRSVLIENLSGLLALATALTVSGKGQYVRIKTAASFAYGVYLSHILFVEGGQDVAIMLGLGKGFISTVWLFILSLAGSLGLCWLLAHLTWAEAFGVPPLRYKQRPTAL